MAWGASGRPKGDGVCRGGGGVPLSHLAVSLQSIYGWVRGKEIDSLRKGNNLSIIRDEPRSLSKQGDDRKLGKKKRLPGRK